jgi:hypothetical protein
MILGILIDDHSETSWYMNLREMVEKFLCPGCSCGMDVTCGKYDPSTDYGHMCSGHVLGTSLNLSIKFALGMPKGFNRSPPDEGKKSGMLKMNIRLFNNEIKTPEWDNLNVPVWAMEYDGFLFVRTYCPRIADQYVDVIENGSLEMVPNAIDVSKFYNEIY